MKLCLVIDPENKYKNRLYYGNRLVASGNNGLEEVHFVTKGKRTIAVLHVAEFDLVVDSVKCPELFHYADIRANRGNADGLRRIGFSCDLLEISANACDGCPMNPDGVIQKFTASNTTR